MNFPLLIIVSALLHVYIGARVLAELAPYPWAAFLFILVLGASAAFMPLGMLARRISRPPLADVLTWVGLLFMGLFSSLFVITVLRDALLAVLWLGNALVPGQLDLPNLRYVTALAVPIGGLLATLLGFWNARRTAAIRWVEVPIAGLPEVLRGFTIAQISDVHVGPTIKRGYLRRIVAKVNSLEPDMVAITGDLVDGQVHELAAHVAPLADLKSRHGSYFVTGNHEYYSGAHAWISELRRLGVRVLMNEHVVLEHRLRGSPGHSSAALVVAGVADWSAHLFDPAHRSDPGAAIAGAPENAGVRMLLAHQPRSAAAAAAAGFDLQLSGHTHGGQFWPWVYFVKLQQPFTAGLHRVGKLWVYTSRGTGYWGPPNRFGSPSEITCIKLIAE
ncbi:MAG: metallophosphoesterase [Pseudomonadota bacterium]